MTSESAPELDGLELPTTPQLPAGNEVETAVRRQLVKLREIGHVEDHHAGLEALAIATARDIDRSFGRGAPSGRANLLRVMNEILGSLPQPVAASRDGLELALDAIRDPEVAAARGAREVRAGA